MVQREHLFLELEDEFDGYYAIALPSKPERIAGRKSRLTEGGRVLWSRQLELRARTRPKVLKLKLA